MTVWMSLMKLMFLGFVSSILGLQTDSFVVRANYGILSNSKEVKSNDLSTQPSDVIYGSKSWDRMDELMDTNKPSVSELQQIVGKIVKGSTKVHQVVKVPAVYEIHLQQEELPKTWNPPQNILKQKFTQKKNKPFYRKPKTTTTWNLPKKLQYFNRVPKHVSYPPQPFQPSSIPINTWKSQYYSTIVPYGNYNFGGHKNLDYTLTQNNQAGKPDLSLYYAKKKELENYGHHRRNVIVAGGTHRKINQRRRSERVQLPFDGINYIIHVKEKKYSD